VNSQRGGGGERRAPPGDQSRIITSPQSARGPPRGDGIITSPRGRSGGYRSNSGTFNQPSTLRRK